MQAFRAVPRPRRRSSPDDHRGDAGCPTTCATSSPRVRPETMLLRAVKGELRSWELLVDLAGDVALQASDCFLLGAALVGSAGDVVAGSLVADHARDQDVPQG